MTAGQEYVQIPTMIETQIVNDDGEAIAIIVVADKDSFIALRDFVDGVGYVLETVTE